MTGLVNEIMESERMSEEQRRNVLAPLKRRETDRVVETKDE